MQDSHVATRKSLPSRLVVERDSLLHVVLEGEPVSGASVPPALEVPVQEPLVGAVVGRQGACGREEAPGRVPRGLDDQHPCVEGVGRKHLGGGGEGQQGVVTQLLVKQLVEVAHEEHVRVEVHYPAVLLEAEDVQFGEGRVEPRPVTYPRHVRVGHVLDLLRPPARRLDPPPRMLRKRTVNQSKKLSGCVERSKTLSKHLGTDNVLACCNQRYINLFGKLMTFWFVEI
mmetsp:Transcript_36565/g.76363  ORF Transcript_36565/g.76363 Transcript_36565/m.76363 type:complete len:228 (-) Transcript_36565:280-963(-)